MKKVFRLIKFAYVAILFKTKMLFVKQPAKELFIVRTDEIGDYILFRNFLQEIRECEQFKNHKITLIGNRAWSTLAEFADTEFVNEFIWLDVNDFWESDFFKTTLTNFKNKRVDLVIVPQAARNWTADRISMMVPAKRKIVAESTAENTTPFTKTIADFFYTKKITVPKSCKNEFLKNTFFFEQLLSKKISFAMPFMQAGNWGLPSNAENKYIVVAPGAGSLQRAWPVEYFEEVIEYLLPLPDIHIVLIGGKAETEIGNKLTTSFTSEKIKNYIGKTSLLESVKIIAGCMGLIANETGIAHIGAALNIKTICLLGGGHFGRFMPYALGSGNINYVYYKMDCYKCGWHCQYNVGKHEAYPCVKNITVEQVKKAIASNILNVDKAEPLTVEYSQPHNN